MKCVVTEMDLLEWDTLPEVDGELPTPRCKAYFREHVAPGVEALARAHMLGPVPPPASDPETVERVARKDAENWGYDYDAISSGERGICQRRAQEYIALALVLNTTDDKEAQGG